MAHQIPKQLLDSLTTGPSQPKISQISTLQNYIQGLLGSTHHTFLQGSYSNHTATSDIPDVDIVAVRNTTYSGTHSPHAQATNGKIGWDLIFNEIESKLRNQQKYSWTVTRGKGKCIEIRGAFDVDVVPAVQYHQDPKVDPIIVYSWKTGQEQMSFPRLHNTNTQTKHSATKDKYRPVVRMLKNWARNHFGDGVISSFQIQALVHSIDNSNFAYDEALNFLVVADEISKKLSAQNPYVLSVCGSEDIISGWNTTDLLAFRAKLIDSIVHGVASYKASTATEAERKWREAFNL